MVLLLFLSFEALLFAIFTAVMLGTQLQAIWNDETVCIQDSHYLSVRLYKICDVYLSECAIYRV